MSTCATAPTGGAIYVELTASPDHARAVGLSDDDHLGGIAQGIDDARGEFGIEGRILDLGGAQLRRRACGRRRPPRRRAPASVRRRVLDGRRRGQLPGPGVRRAVRDRRRGRPRLHDPRRRVGRAAERPRRADPAGHPDRSRRPRDRGPAAGRRARRARDRPQHAARRATSSSGSTTTSRATRCRRCARRG